MLAAIRLGQLEFQHVQRILESLEPATLGQLNQLYPAIADLDDSQKMRLFDVALDATCSATLSERQQFKRFFDLAVTEPEIETDVGRWSWQYLVGSRLSGAKEKPPARYGSMSDVLVETLILISCVVLVQLHQMDNWRRRAFAKPSKQHHTAPLPHPFRKALHH